MLARKGLSKKRIFILGGIMVVVWGIIGVVVYRTFAPPPPSPESPAIVLPTQPIPGTGEPQLETPTDIGLEILRDPRLTNLKIFGEVPVEVKVLGRNDPFSLINP